MRKHIHQPPVALALAAGWELINAIYRVRRGGPEKDAVAAWAARERLRGIDPRSVDASTETLLHKLQDAVERATRGSCTRWKAEAIEPAVKELQEALPAELAPPAPPESPVKALLPCHKAAYEAYMEVAKKAGRPLTDEEAYKKLKLWGIGNYKLPKLGSWKRYLREARPHYEK